MGAKSCLIDPNLLKILSRVVDKIYHVVTWPFLATQNT